MICVYFNPRSHERSDRISISTVLFPWYFNPRSHERSDKKPLTGNQSLYNFNPRSHERSDGRYAQLTFNGEISIHAPTRGATLTQVWPCLRFRIFQSTLPREERLWRLFRWLLQTVYFNPRSHERSDCACSDMPPRTLISIHAPTRGATTMVSYPSSSSLFQSTLPREERRGESVADFWW